VAERSPKAPSVSGDTRDPALNIDSAKWRQIEKAYGLPLPPNVRAEIVRATQAFLFFESFERTAEPLAKVKVILEAHEKAATRFFNELFASPFAGSDAGVYAHHLIEKNFKASQLSSDNAGLDTLLNLIRAFHIACNASIKQLNEASVSSNFRKDNPWTNWISRLTEIFSGVKLPVAVRKDIGNKSRSDKDSPFTLLVWELQSCLPSECRRHTRSVTALSDAISEERKISEQISPAGRSPARTRQQAGKKSKR